MTEPGSSSERLDLLLLETFGYTNLPPLGLLYVASYAESLGYSARVLVLQSQVVKGPRGAFSRTYLEQLLYEHRPRVVGLSVYAESQAAVTRCCRRIRECCDAKILLGGPQASAAPFDVMDRTGADAVIVGDGEAKTARVLEAWAEGGSPENLDGILFRSNGEVRHGELSRDRAADIESLPVPDFSLMLNRDSGVRTMVTARGCPYRCTFCFEGGCTSHRIRPLDAVKSELRALLTGAPVSMFVFLDDTFTLNKKRLKEICTVLREHYRGPWFCEGRIEVLYRDPEIIDILANSGVTRIQLGLESGSQKVLDAYRKNSTPEQIRMVFERCAKAGIISVIGNFIVGGALEDEESFRESLEMARDLIDLCPGAVELMTCFLYPYRGTAVQERPEEFDLEFVDDLEYFDSISRIVPFNRTRRLSRGEISQLRMTLDAFIRKHMLSKMNDLPASTIERHLLLARDHHIASEWYNTIVRCPGLAVYARFLLEFDKRAWSEIRDRPDWLQWCPVRMGTERSREEGDELVLRARNDKEVRLTGLDRRFFQLSAGRLSLAEMMPFLRSEPGLSDLDEPRLEEELRESNERLAADFLLAYGEL